MPGIQALAVFQPAQLFDRRYGNMRIRTDAPGPAGFQVGAQREQSVTQVGLGGRADRHGCATVGHALDFGGGEMGGVHQGPAWIDGEVLQQPFHRARTQQRYAVLHFTDLFSDMDMHGHVAGQCRQHFAHRRFRHRTQAVEGATDAQAIILPRTQGFDQAQERIHTVAETLLARIQRAPVKTAGHVQHRQQSHADAGIACGSNQRPRHRGRIGIGAAIRLVMQVMEFAHAGVAGFQHFRIQLRGHRIGAFRGHARGEAVHGFAPGPETVLRLGLVFGQARHGALEGMGMQIGDAGQHPGTGVGHRDAKAGVGLPALRAPDLRNLPRGIECGHAGILARAGKERERLRLQSPHGQSCINPLGWPGHRHPSGHVGRRQRLWRDRRRGAGLERRPALFRGPPSRPAR